jgi:glycosyltransferase 2 family protein
MMKTLLKSGFTLGLLAWMISSGRLDALLILQLLEMPKIIVLASIALGLHLIFASVRWRFMLQLTTPIPIPLTQVIKLNWIGLYFNCFLPGAVTGDIGKVYYAKKLIPTAPIEHLMTSALLDRMLGFISLISIISLSTFVNYSPLIKSIPEVAPFLPFAGLFTLLVLFILLPLFLPVSLQSKLLFITSKSPLAPELLQKILKALWLVQKRPLALFYALLLSFFLHGLSISTFLVLTSPFMEGELSPFLAITLIPLGLLSTSIPIAPEGLGVGHVAFQELFKFADLRNGASLFNIYVLFSLMFNMIGGFFYLRTGKLIPLKEQIFSNESTHR